MAKVLQVQSSIFSLTTIFFDNLIWLGNCTSSFTSLFFNVNFVLQHSFCVPILCFYGEKTKKNTRIIHNKHLRTKRATWALVHSGTCGCAGGRFICFVWMQCSVGKQWQWQQQIAVFQKVQQFTWRYWNGSLFSCSNFLSSSSGGRTEEWDKNVRCVAAAVAVAVALLLIAFSLLSVLLLFSIFLTLLNERLNESTQHRAGGESEKVREKWHTHSNGFGVRSYVMMMPLLRWWRCRWMIEPNKMFVVSRKCGFLISFKMLWRAGC